MKGVFLINSLFLAIKSVWVMEKFYEYLDMLGEQLTNFAPTFLQAVAILVIGFWIIKKIGKILVYALQKAGLAPEVISFLSSLLSDYRCTLESP